MKKNRLVFYGIFALFHLVAFIFTVVLDNNTNLLFRMVGWVPSFKWITLFGLLLLVVDVTWAMLVHREAAKEKAALLHELNTLKAKLFDMQEVSKKQVPPQPTTKPNA